MKPIHLQILDAEHVLLAKMRKSFIFYCGMTLRNINECCVDSCLVQTGNKKGVAAMEKMIQLTRQDLTFQQPSDGIYNHMKAKAVVVT